MPNITSYDIIQCSQINPTETSVNEDLSAFVDSYVEFDGDNEKTFSVKKNVQARFFHPASPSLGQTAYYSVASFKVNGLEALSAPANLSLDFADLDYIDFPNYIADPTGYTAGVANAVDYSIVGFDAGYVPANFSVFLQGVADSINLDITVLPSHPDWWDGVPFPSIDNFSIEQYSDGDINITVEETISGTTRELRYVFNGSTAEYYIDGVLHQSPPESSDEIPQYSDEYSFYNNNLSFSYTSTDEVSACPVLSAFSASLETNGCSNITVDCDCQNITFSDNSNYSGNGLAGHSSEDFDFRRIEIVKPDGETYVFTTDTTDTEADEYINAHDNSNNSFTYNFDDDDVDGIYEVKLCTYPTWQSDDYYDSLLNNRVYYNGVVYKQVSSSVGENPELDTDNQYWIPLTDDEQGDTATRYCTSSKIVILCISILSCYKASVKNAFCGLDANPCQDVCDNPEFMKAMKLKITLDSLSFASCSGDWNSVKKHIAILKSICCCNG
jgi:hypothetical protein